jgi:hypothetical protein
MSAGCANRRIAAGSTIRSGVPAADASRRGAVKLQWRPFNEAST